MFENVHDCKEGYSLGKYLDVYENTDYELNLFKMLRDCVIALNAITNLDEILK